MMAGLASLSSCLLGHRQASRTFDPQALQALTPEYQEHLLARGDVRFHTQNWDVPLAPPPDALAESVAGQLDSAWHGLGLHTLERRIRAHSAWSHYSNRNREQHLLEAAFHDQRADPYQGLCASRQGHETRG